jgi:hypothetical protein
MANIERKRYFFGNEISTTGLSGVTEHLTHRGLDLDGKPDIIQLAKTTYHTMEDGIETLLIGWRLYQPFAD